MPAGPAPVGIAVFAAIKLAGYCAAAAFLNDRFPDRKAHVLLVGGARTVIGLVTGICAVGGLETLGVFRSEWLFLVLLIPLRMGEWLLLLWLFYRKPAWNARVMIRYSALGTIWSFCLDLPAILAVFALPGGIWIC